jgi:hypothetical protein
MQVGRLPSLPRARFDAPIDLGIYDIDVHRGVGRSWVKFTFVSNIGTFESTRTRELELAQFIHFLNGPGDRSVMTHLRSYLVVQTAS